VLLHWSERQSRYCLVRIESPTRARFVASRVRWALTPSAPPPSRPAASGSRRTDTGGRVRAASPSPIHSLRYGADVRDLCGPALGNAIAMLRRATRYTTDPCPDAIREAVECLGTGNAELRSPSTRPQSDDPSTGCSITRVDLGSVEFSTRWGSPCPASGVAGFSPQCYRSR
jgi:hypothetical protein